MENNLITLVPQQGAFIVNGQKGKYCVTLFPKETCQCLSTSTCYHILAAKMSIGLEAIQKNRVVNLRALSKNSKKKIDKKSGRKQPRVFPLHFRVLDLPRYKDYHRHSNYGPPFFLICSLPRLWYESLSGSISLNHLSIFYNISYYNSLVLRTFVSRSSCRITYIYIKVWNNRQNTKRESSLRLDILQ